VPEAPAAPLTPAVAIAPPRPPVAAPPEPALGMSPGPTPPAQPLASGDNRATRPASVKARAPDKTGVRGQKRSFIYALLFGGCGDTRVHRDPNPHSFPVVDLQCEEQRRPRQARRLTRRRRERDGWHDDGWRDRHGIDIERALRDDYSQDRKKARPAGVSREPGAAVDAGAVPRAAKSISEAEPLHIDLKGRPIVDIN